MNKACKSLSAVLIAFALLSVSSPARAGGIDPGVLQKFLGTKPAAKNNPLYLTDNKDKIIRLDRDAASVIVNNPAHASVLLDSPRLLIVMPRAPGATSFSVLDAAGNTILQKDIIVSNVQRQYVRIQRVCDGNSSCAPTSYYYCPNGCYQVTPVPGSNTGAANIPPPPPPPSAHNGGAEDSSMGNNNLRAPAQNIIHSTGRRAYPGMIP